MSSSPNHKPAPRRKLIYVCDVCGKRFPVNAETARSEHEILCPRCRTPLVRPALRRSGEPPRCMAFS